MKNRHLVILLSIFGVLIAMIVILSAVFSVSEVEPICCSWSDLAETNSVDIEIKNAASSVKRKNIFLFNKNDVINIVNSQVTRADVIDVECYFPNKVVIKYDYIDDALQFCDGNNYYISGANGKITAISNYDYTDEHGEHYHESIIEVKTSEYSGGRAVCEYAFSNGTRQDKILSALMTIPETHTNADGTAVFNVAAYKCIDLTNATTTEVILKNGVKFRFLGDKNFDEMVLSVFSTYSEKARVSPESLRTGLVMTVSDANYTTVAVSSN